MKNSEISVGRILRCSSSSISLSFLFLFNENRKSFLYGSDGWPPPIDGPALFSINSNRIDSRPSWLLPFRPSPSHRPIKGLLHFLEPARSHSTTNRTIECSFLFDYSLSLSLSQQLCQINFLWYYLVLDRTPISVTATTSHWANVQHLSPPP